VNIVGGVKVKEPAIDLVVALAIASAHRNQVLDRGRGEEVERGSPGISAPRSGASPRGPTRPGGQGLDGAGPELEFIGVPEAGQWTVTENPDAYDGAVGRFVDRWAGLAHGEERCAKPLLRRSPRADAPTVSC